MAAHDIAPWVPDLRVPRMWPCQATGIGPGAISCGATPASLWKRQCVHGHARQCWLCPVHAKMLASGMGSCADCAARGLRVCAWLVPVDLLLLGHAGKG